MQTRAFSKRLHKTTETCLYLKFTGFVTHVLKLLSTYNLSRSMPSFHSLYSRTQCNVSHFVDTVNFTVFQKAVTSGAYKISASKGAFLKEQLFLVSAISLVFPIFAVLIIPDLIQTIFAKTLVLIFRTAHLIHIRSVYY